MQHTARIAFVITLSLLAVSHAAAFEMSAGVAKAKITNEKSRVMVNGNMSEGVAQDIYARCLVLDDGDAPFAIITYDLNCLDVGAAHLRQRALDELGIPQERLILLATHNHNAPIQINPDNFDYGRRIGDQMFDLIREAQANAVGPVTVEFGFGDGYFITSRGNAPTDYEIQVIKVMHEDQPLALLFNHGVHPAQATARKIDAGHPGFAMDIIEREWPGVQAMYCDASGGNQFVVREKDYQRKLLAARTRGDDAVDEILTETAMNLGKELADRTLEIASGPLTDVTGPIHSELRILSLPLADPIPREEAEKLATRVPEGTGFVPYPNEYRGTNWVRMLLYWYEKGLPFPKTTAELVCTDDTYLIHETDTEMLDRYSYSIHERFPCVYEEVIAASIGPMAFVAMQGEVCAPIGMRIKDAFRRDMPIFCTAYMGEHNLYIPTRELVRLDAYQSKVIQIQYASPVGWSPDVEDAMVNGVIDFVEEVMSETSAKKDPGRARRRQGEGL